MGSIYANQSLAQTAPETRWFPRSKKMASGYARCLGETSILMSTSHMTQVLYNSIFSKSYHGEPRDSKSFTTHPFRIRGISKLSVFRNWKILRVLFVIKKYSEISFFLEKQEPSKLEMSRGILN